MANLIHLAVIIAAMLTAPDVHRLFIGLLPVSYVAVRIWGTR